MNTSICITTLNEEKSIGPLLDALYSQSKKADEIIIVDAGSMDKTLEIINHYPACISYAGSIAGRQKKAARIILLVEPGCSRAKGRNLGVEIAKSEIIAMTDAGCVPRPDWLKNITLPFETDRVGVSVGFYTMTGVPPVSRAMSVFLGTAPHNFDVSFLPSTRSIAFRKSEWLRIGGFPESSNGTAEDTVFNYKLLKSGVKLARVKSAIVEWGMPVDIKEFFWKVFDYAKGDAKSKIWIFPGKSLTSHNIKALSVVLRYLIAVILFFYCLIISPPLFVYLFICIFGYFLWAFRKVFLEKGKVEVAIWGPVLQVVADVAVIGGFISGIIGK